MPSCIAANWLAHKRVWTTPVQPCGEAPHSGQPKWAAYHDVISSRAYADFSPSSGLFSAKLFIGFNFYCESGHTIFIVSLGITVPLVGELPLTHIFCLTICGPDGSDCPIVVESSLVWQPQPTMVLYRELCEATMDDVEVRMCTDQSGVLMGQLELYIQ